MKLSLPINTLCFGLALLAPALSQAQTSSAITQSAKLSHVTVFLRGAELFNSASVNLAAGENELVLDNISTHLNRQSLSLSASNGVQILSFQIKNKVIDEDEALSPQAEALHDKLKAAQREQEQLGIRNSVVAEQIRIIEENRRLGNEKTGVSASELDSMLTLIEQKMISLLTAQAETTLALEKNSKVIRKLSQQFEDEKLKSLRSGAQIAIKLHAPQAGSSTLSFSYVVPDAGWMPTYDLRAKAINEPISLIYKADIFQTSGINWNNVRLTLSTGNPSRGAQAPGFSPWHIAPYNPAHRVQYDVDYAADRAAPTVAPMMQSSGAAEEVGKSAAKPAAVMPSTLNNHVTINTSGISTDYEISLPYSIPSDGKGHLVMVKSADLKGDYRYTALPRQDKDAFLQARIKRSDMDALSGKTNIYYGDSYVGEGVLDTTDAQKDSIDISLGRDKKIIINRENDKTFEDKPSFFGNNTDKTYAYSISVRNTRAEAINIDLVDQIPVSDNSDIKVLDIKHDNAEYNKENGMLTWKLKLAPGESRAVKFSYVVRHPKDLTVTGL